MDPEKLKERVQNLVPEAGLEENKQFPVFVIPSAKLHELAEKLFREEDLAFDYLFCLTGVDRGKQLEVVYHLTSTHHGHSLVLKVQTEDRLNPAFDTVCDIWKTAEFHEREVYDLLGVRFNHHPDLRRIFLEEDWPGYPLRKDYKDEVNIVEL
ncbi:MAG TPA: NADH-quinone oxidoreductase subunit C [Bacteroidales bacterium]|nr:NADH-quinone oxidoreductase subunit C [Bacteroidales bacterium]